MRCMIACNACRGALQRIPVGFLLAIRDRPHYTRRWFWPDGRSLHRREPMPHPAADRNLLFGVLALQMDFVGRDDLIAAMNAWVLDKDRSLGQVLREQGKLADDE